MQVDNFLVFKKAEVNPEISVSSYLNNLTNQIQLRRYETFKTEWILYKAFHLELKQKTKTQYTTHFFICKIIHMNQNMIRIIFN